MRLNKAGPITCDQRASSAHEVRVVMLHVYFSSGSISLNCAHRQDINSRRLLQEGQHDKEARACPVYAQQGFQGRSRIQQSQHVTDGSMCIQDQTYNECLQKGLSEEEDRGCAA